MWESPPVGCNMPLLKNRDILGALWWSSGWDSVLSALRAQVQSLLRELRSHKLGGLLWEKIIGLLTSPHARYYHL